MNDVIAIALFVGVSLLALFIVPQWRLKRAIPKVIRIFREYYATGSKNAKTVDELGFKPQGTLQRMLKGRDYKQYALKALMKAEIIQATEDGRLYLSEDKLAASGLDKGTSYYR